MAHGVVRIYRHDAALVGAPVEARHQSAVAASVEHVRVVRVGSDVAAFAAAGRVEDRWEAAFAGATLRLAADACRAVVLLRAAYVIRHMPGQEDVIELG